MTRVVNWFRPYFQGWDGDGDGDGEIYTEMGMGKISWGRDGENFMGMRRGWGQFYLPCHSLMCILHGDGPPSQRSVRISANEGNTDMGVPQVYSTPNYTTQ